MATTFKDKNVTIKKDRKCYSCYRKFEKGTVMNYWAGLYEGDFNSVYSCLTCRAVMGKDTENEFPEGYVYDSLSEGQTPEDYLATLK